MPALPPIPFVQAKHYHRGRLKKIRLLVIHDMEAAEESSTAEGCARMFATTTREASAHYAIDNNSIVQCVKDADTAFGAKGANADGLHIEHAGFADQSRAQWVDAYSRAELALSARLVARKCRQYGIPVRHVGPSQIRAGARGICGHIDVTNAYPPGSGHYDPGPHFPWDVYLTMVQAEADALGGKPWTRSRLTAAAAAAGVTAAVFAGVTATSPPTPKPTPSTSTTTTRPATQTPSSTTPATSTTRPPSSSRPSTTPAVRTTTRTVTRTVTATRTVRPAPLEYVIVSPGDTLTAIARARAAAGRPTTVADLRRLNPFLDPLRLQPGTLVRTR